MSKSGMAVQTEPRHRRREPETRGIISKGLGGKLESLGLC